MKKLPDILSKIPLEVNVIGRSNRHEDMIKLAEEFKPIRTLLALSPADQSLALSLLEQARGLRKVCPWCTGKKTVITYPNYEKEDCRKCNGTGSVPVTADDVEVMVR